MMRLFPFCLILCISLSSFTLVNGIPGYWGTVIRDTSSYINFYLKPNKTKSKMGYAELCDTKSKTCEDVADGAPEYTKKKGVEYTQGTYYFVYPPHSKTHKQLTVIVHYDYLQRYEGWEEKYQFINNETTLFMEYKWTLDKLEVLRNTTSYTISYDDTFLFSTRENVKKTKTLICINLVIAFYAFFGSLVPRWFFATPFLVWFCSLLSESGFTERDKMNYYFILFVLLINFKPNPRFRLIFLIIVFALVEFYYYWHQTNQFYLLSALSLLLWIIMTVISYQKTKDMKNRFTIFAAAHIGVCATFYFYSFHFFKSFPSWFGLVFASRHIVSLISVIFQVKMTKEYVESDIASETKKAVEPTLLSADDAEATNNDTLTNSLL